MTKRRTPMFTTIGIVILIAALIMVLWPLVKPGFYVTDDGEWMVIRLSAFYQSLASGQFPVRFLGRLNHSYGYPVSNFLYPGFLYIGSMLRLFGFSFVDAVKYILLFSVSGSALMIYVTLRKRFSALSSTYGTLSFITAPYLLYDLYVRGSVGEIVGVAAAAISVFAIVHGYTWLLALAFAFLITAHNSVALITGVGLLLLILSGQEKIKNLTAIVMGIGFASFFWMPALLEKSIVRFDQTAISNPHEYLVSLNNAPLLGFAFVLAVALILGFRKKITPVDRTVFALVVVGLLLALPISKAIWNVDSFTRLVQFPYRFLVLPVLFGPWVVSFVLEHLNGWHKTALSLLFLILFVLGCIPILTSIRFVDRPPGYYTTNEGTTTVANEYMPLWVTDFPSRRPVETIEVLDGDAEFTERTFIGERFSVTVVAREVSLIQINKLYYPGWGITIDSMLVPVNYHNPYGVMRIVVPNGTHTIRGAFRETPVRFFADLITVASAIMLCLVTISDIRKKRSK